MKKKSLVFFCIAFLILSVLPAINIYIGNRDFKIKKMYSIDFLIPSLSKFLYGYGVNFFSDQVVIGRDGWLFLGDRYSSTLTLLRNGVDSNYNERLVGRSLSLQGWNSFFSEQGVSLFKILVGPNKSSMYPEFLPGWVSRANNNKIDLLLKNDSNNYFVYPKGSLELAKEKYSDHDLYYKTDTHWNSLGAWIGFDYFINTIKSEGLGISYNQSVDVKGDSVIVGGDLSGFLRISGALQDKEPDLEVSSGKEVKVTCEKFYTREYYDCGDLKIISQMEPLLVVSERAENAKKVLWLRDSFGTAVSPYMARMFSNVVQIHYSSLTKNSLIALVKDFQPDYIFMTIVERDIDVGLPVDYPYKEKYAGDLVVYNDISSENDAFSISGNDPYLVYKLKKPARTSQGDYIAMKLLCDSRNSDGEMVDLQVFWKGADDEFSEINSSRFSVEQGEIELDLSSSSNWGRAENIEYLRLDIEPSATDKCAHFNVRDFVFNKF